MAWNITEGEILNMKQRIISAAIGIALFITVMFANSVPFVFNAVISIVAVMAIWELFVATKYVSNKPLLITCMAFAAIVPFFRDPYFNLASKTSCFLFIFILFIIMIKNKDSLRMEQIGLVFMMCTLIPFSFSSLIYLRDLSLDPHMHLWRRDGVFLVILAAIGAWIADAGAYFVGKAFGKHKLSPEISPNKTVEGFVGGIVFNMVAFVVACIAFQLYDHSVAFNYPLLLILAIFCACAGTVGDLAASFIKRSCHIKDFGRIMPGHGGVLDRFDSMLMVAPLLYVVLQILQPIYPLIIR